jgi:uncharacterized glyoxalase superfamily protein PhnB
MTKPVPDGCHTITPHLIIRDCDKALTFYEKAFAAEVVGRSAGPAGKIMHAAVKIGDSMVMMADEFPEMGDRTSKAPVSLGGTSVVLNIYCDDADAWYRRAIKAGAESLMAPADMFWGDRYSQIRDPFGHSWAIATRREDVTPEELNERAQKWMEETAQNAPKQ